MKEAASARALSLGFDNSYAPTVAEVVADYKLSLPSLMVALGKAKLIHPRTHPEVVSIDRKITEHGLRLVEHHMQTEEGTIVPNFYQRASAYIRKETNFSTLREFVRSNYDITMEGRDALQKDVSGRKVVMLLNHYRQGPEIVGFPTEEIGASLQGHDFAPLLAKLFLDEAVEPTGIEVSRYGKPLYSEDEFYYRSALDAGTVPISGEGVEELAQQFSQTWTQGKIPTVCPEAGLRCLEQWRSGGLVAACLADADAIALVAQSPWISLIDRNVDFHYIGVVPLPSELKAAVRRGDKQAIQQFNEGIRQIMAKSIIDINFDPAYTAGVQKSLQNDHTIMTGK